MFSDEVYSECLGFGEIHNLSDEPCDVSNKLPLGFPIPGGESMTPYRERLKKGVYSAEQPDGYMMDTERSEPKRKTTKRASAKRATTKRGTRSK